MTSSLVGSEMCIRDRNNLDLETRSPSCKEEKSIPVVASQMVADINPPAPVSYTHLTLPTICSV
eukprot:10708055-Prorocentrum_lima.AAC.1